MRFCAFSYSIAEPCGRSFQVSMYFIGVPNLIQNSRKPCARVRRWQAGA